VLLPADWQTYVSLSPYFGTLKFCKRKQHIILGMYQVSLPKVSPPCIGGEGGGLVWFCDPESYAGGSVATGRASHTGQVEG